MKRGEVLLARFGPPTGPEQAGDRPAIVMQDDSLTPALTTVLIVPVTTNLRRLSMPCTVAIPAGEGGLDRESVALGYQVQAKGKARLVERLGAFAPDLLASVEDAVLTALGA